VAQWIIAVTSTSPERLAHERIRQSTRFPLRAVPIRFFSLPHSRRYRRIISIICLYNIDYRPRQRPGGRRSRSTGRPGRARAWRSLADGRRMKSSTNSPIVSFRSNRSEARTRVFQSVFFCAQFLNTLWKPPLGLLAVMAGRTASGL